MEVDLSVIRKIPEVIREDDFKVTTTLLRPVRKVGDFSTQVNACDEPSQLFKQVEVIQFRRSAAVAFERGKAEIINVMQGVLMDLERRKNRNFLGGQLMAEIVFFLDLFIGPAAGPIKLHDDGCGLFDAYLVNPVFVAVERQQSAIAE